MVLELEQDGNNCALILGNSSCVYEKLLFSLIALAGSSGGAIA